MRVSTSLPFSTYTLILTLMVDLLPLKVLRLNQDIEKHMIKYETKNRFSLKYV